MPMRATTVRFSEDQWTTLEREAAAQGTSAAQLVRDATIMRLAFLMAHRGDEEARAAIAQMGPAVPPASDPPAAPGAPPLPTPNPRRVEALRRAGLLEREPEPQFDRLARIASQVLNAPVAMVSLVGDDGHFFKSCVGMPVEWTSSGELPLTHSFCRHTVAQGSPLVVGDTREHPLLKDNPAVADLDAKAYAGIPLITPDGLVLGTLCVVDRQARVWTRDQVALLSDLAATVVHEVEMRRRAAGDTSGTLAE